MEEKEKRPDGAKQENRRKGCMPAVVIVAVTLAMLFMPLRMAFMRYGPGTGSGAFFESVAAFQEKFAPIMAFPTYYPEGFDWRGHEEEWFEYRNELGKVYFNWNTYNLKSDRTHMYANATYNKGGVKYQSRKDLEIYESAEIGVSLAYPVNSVPSTWLFYVGMTTSINPLMSNPNTPNAEDTREILQYQDKKVCFSARWWDNSGTNEESFTTMYYDMVFEDRDYRFEFGVWVDRTLSREKREELFAEMKQRCLEEAVKMYDSLEYLEKAGG